MTVLGELCGSPAFAGLVLTEVNPTHDPGGELLGRYLDGVTAAMSGQDGTCASSHRPAAGARRTKRNHEAA